MSKSSNRIKNFLPYLICWVIALSIGLYFRLYPLIYHTSSDAYDKASLLVLSRLRSTISYQINKNAPHTPELEKKLLAQNDLNRLIRDESKNVRYSIDKMAKEIDKKYPGAKKGPYLLEADPYNFFGLTKNILRMGRISDTIKGSKYLNRMMLAPLGHLEPLSLHPYVGFFLYKFLTLFNSQISLMYALGFTPLVIMAFALIAFLWVCRILGCTILSTLAGSLFLVLSPIFAKRSAFGWYDNDPYNILFPLLIFGSLFVGFDKNLSLKQKSFYAVFTSFLIGLYALFWQGWVYVLGIIFISSVSILVYNHFTFPKKEDSRKLLWYLGVINAGAFLAISLIFGIGDFFALFNEGWTALRNFLERPFTSWPDVYLGVGELRRESFGALLDQISIIPFFLVAAFGFIASLIKAWRKPEKYDALKTISLSILFIFSTLLALGAQRFAILSLVPLTLFFTLGVETITELSKENSFCRNLPSKQKDLIVQSAMALIIGITLVFAFRQTRETMLLWRPIFNETWEKALVRIQKETPNDSIINSWWPPGHFITSIAERRVTFDGATINNPQAYWMANLLLSQDENYSVGILRMLNNCANQAVDYLQTHGLKLSQAVKIIKEIATLPRAKAKAALNGRLSEEQIEELLNLTHKNPPPSYILIYNDLIDKNLELSFIGKWNFEAVEKIQNSKELQKQIPPNNSNDYIKFLWNLCGGPLNNSETLGQMGRKDDLVFFAQGITVNLNDMTCRVASKKFGKGIPQSIIYMEGNSLKEKKFDGANLAYSIMLFKDGSVYNAMAVDRRLAASLLFRLYFFEGQGLKYIEPFTNETDLTKRTRIYVYKINWAEFNKDLGP